ncbi:MAG TPA: nucleoside-diphosphate kinase [Clostridia bacterium]
MDSTFIILKPDAVKRGLTGEIITRFEKKGFEIAKMKMDYIKKETLAEHYAHLVAKPFYGEIEQYMMSGPCFFMILNGKDAVKTVRAMMGNTNALEAPPGTIRGDYGASSFQNLIHGSDSDESFIAEAKRFFPDYTL